MVLNYFFRCIKIEETKIKNKVVFPFIKLLIFIFHRTGRTFWKKMEAIKNFYRNYICLNLNEFENLSADLEINKVLFFLALGICAACFVLNYYQSVISLFLKKLIRAEATAENAKTLSDLGLKENKTLKKLILKDGGVLKRAVSVIGLKKLTFEEYKEAEARFKQAKKEKSEKGITKPSALEINFDEAKFYMTEEQRAYADHAYKTNDGSIIKTSLYCLLIIALYFVAVFLMPSILSAINNMLA